MPRSGQDDSGNPQGVDLAVAQLLATELGRDIEFHWCENDACRLQSLKAQRCDVVIGVPHESVNSPDVSWASPFAAGKFGLVTAKTETRIRSFTELKGKRVGIVSGTIPLSSQEHTVLRFPSREELLHQFEKSNLAAALVDTDFANWYLSEHPELDLRVVDEFVSPYRWTFGIAVRANDGELLAKISQAVDICLRQAKFVPLFADYGLKFRPPIMGAVAEIAPETRNSWVRARQTGVLRVSMDPANLPYSSADPDKPGFDVEIARALAKELGLKIEIEWIDIHSETATGELLDDECDLAMGVAVDPSAMDDEESLAGKVIYSQPYYGTGYVLIAREGADPIKELSDLTGEKSRTLGTQAGTIADYSLRQRGYQRRLFGTQLGVLSGLNNGSIDYAYMWPNIVWMLANEAEAKAALVEGYVPEDRWNIAVALRKYDDEFKQHVDDSLEKIAKQGIIEQAMERYNMPYFAPFPETRKVQEEVSATRPKPFDRGLEPQMGRRERSRRSYSGLEKIRSRGTIVIGLDQNNLPFSTVHPQPAGFDYEISELLAEQLGVSLEIYWAYSSHDSYPAKLAHKQLCDVILGVMPDDRFAGEVVFSNPYYFASYVYAVPKGGRIPSADQLIATEPGIAVRGLKDRRTQTYPQLIAILSAVAAGDVSAGYVISTRAQWLAGEKWPGKIDFLTPELAVDRFPICAAVRRNDLDLRDALDYAFEVLRNSGQLAQVFARWHIDKPDLTP